MRIVNLKHVMMVGSVAALIGFVAACAPKPAPPPPPPPKVAQIPPRPYPPMGASPNYQTPERMPDGSRNTVNYGLSPEQTLWNLRSAYNVAALNCLKPEHAVITANYGQFLKLFRKQLASANKTLDLDFKKQYGKDYIREREVFQTQVYNYFALPPVIPALCDAAVGVSNDIRAVPPSQLEAQAPAELAKIDKVYRDFFDSYDRYRADLLAWQTRYSPQELVPPAHGTPPLTASMKNVPATP